MTVAGSTVTDERTMTTYRCANGGAIYGEYTFMTSDEWADDDGDPIAVTEEVWVLKSERTYVAGQKHLWCSNCGENARLLTVEEVLADSWPSELCAECNADPEVEK